jgi:FHA domain
MLFHITIRHSAEECPGRRRTDPPDLVAAMHAREAHGEELQVKLHSVLWSAACMVWGQPEHLAFALLEAEDTESALQYVKALVPECWALEAVPVWDLPAQLPLVSQIRLAPSVSTRVRLEHVEVPLTASISMPVGNPEPAAVMEIDTTLEVPALARERDDEPLPSAAGTVEVAVPPEPEPESPGTITRLVIALDTPIDEAATQARGALSEGASVEREHPSHASGSSPRALLIATAGLARGRTFLVPVDGATIGRQPENAVCLPDERLSREHARIEFRESQFWLRDLGSTNGTALNGNLLSSPQVIGNGDTIDLGSNTLVVTIDPTS